MSNPNNISILSDCYGCGVCSAACPKNIIRIVKNKDGFYEPRIISADSCIRCGICLDVCAFHNKLTFEEVPVASYASWSTNTEIRRNSSSGGIGYELAQHSIEEGLKACGVKYDARSGRAVHFICETEEDLNQTLGSKYIPSYTESAFNSIFSKGNKNRYIVFGTPCQIASLRLLIRRKKREDDFILVDFFCHGVPSLNVWDKYLSEKKIHQAETGSIRWRDKKFGWHDSWYVVVLGSDGYELYRSSEVSKDEFYNFFLGHYALNPCCLNSCKFKKFKSSADIRIGDLWGEKYMKNQDGVSGVLCFTDRGNKAVKSNSNIFLAPESPDVVAAGQMDSNASVPSGYKVARFFIRHSNLSLSHILNIVDRANFFKSMPIILCNKIRKYCRQ